MNTFRLAILALVVLGCARPEPIEPQLRPIRSYGWNADVIDPDPEWNPAAHMLVMRSMGGFSLLEEGARGQRRFAENDRRESHQPRWINAEQFVFGPGWNARRGPDGTVTMPSEGLTVVTLDAGGDRPRRVPLTDRGWRPQPAGPGRIVAQAGNRILLVGTRGEVEVFGEGFDVVAQADGQGLAWRDLPATDPDWWTGRSGPGSLYVRWAPNRVDVVPGAVQAAWTRHGAVLAVIPLAEAPRGQPWWAAGTRLVRLDRAGAAPTDLRRGVRDPATSPATDLLAWVGDDDGVWIGTAHADGWSERLAEAGSRPRWSHDGLRVCWLAPPDAGSQLPRIRVTVLAPH